MINSQSLAPVLQNGDASTLSGLRTRISRLCQTVRFAALGYALWTLYLIISHWISVETINNGYGRLLGVDLSGLRPWQQAAGFGLNLSIWVIVAIACYCAWRLFSAYLNGEIFSTVAAIWLQRMAMFGLIAQIADIAARPLLSIFLTLHFLNDQKMRIVNIFVLPNDVIVLLLLSGFLALAHIQKAAAEIAAENAQFV